MAAVAKYKQWTVTAAAAQLDTILNLNSTERFISNILVRLSPDAAASSRLYWGGPSLTNGPTNAGGVLKPGDGVTIELQGKYIGAANLYFAGTAGETAFFTLIS